MTTLCLTAALFLLLLAFGGRDRWLSLIVFAPWGAWKLWSWL